MQLIITRDAHGLRVLARWVDLFAGSEQPHERNIIAYPEETALMPNAVVVALATLMDWAEGELEPALIRQNERYETRREIDREIEKLQRRKADLAR